MVAKKRCARVEAPSFPAGDLELVIKYKEPCFARSQLVLAPSLFLARPRLLASPFGMPGIQRGLYLIRDFIRFTSSRGLGAVELGANDRLTPSPRLPGNGIASVMERQFLMEIFVYAFQILNFHHDLWSFGFRSFAFLIGTLRSVPTFRERFGSLLRGRPESNATKRNVPIKTRRKLEESETLGQRRPFFVLRGKQTLGIFRNKI